MNDFIKNVRLRPGMYVGDTENGMGLMHMAFTVLDCLDGLADGAPIFVEMCSGRKLRFFVPDVLFDMPSMFEFVTDEQYSSPNVDGLSINWMPVVNALSAYFRIENLTPHGPVLFDFSKGEPQTPSDEILSKQGLLIEFEVCEEIFPAHLTFSQDALLRRLDELTALTGHQYEFDGQMLQYSDLAAWLKKRLSVDGKVFTYKGPLGDEAQNICIDIALTECADEITGYVNTVKTQGGVHVDGVKALLKRGCPETNVPYGGVVHIRHPRPQFRNPTRDVLANAEIPDMIEAALREPLRHFLKP